MPRISSKHQITLPVEVLANAGLTAGDEVTIVPAVSGG
jgi:bifunctional DNA-binding transcriptional regulator/antitoxin component of YhaV-PrlF toxin-antitoxin module